MRKFGLYFHNHEIKPRFPEVSGGIIQSESSWIKRKVVPCREPILFIRDYAYNKQTMSMEKHDLRDKIPWYNSVCEFQNSLVNFGDVTGSEDYKQALNSWNLDGQVPGSIFLTRDAKLIWISDVDLKYFDKE